MTDTPPGVVSPYPEFFAGLAKLARDTAQIVQTNLVTETFESRRIAAEILRIQQESRQARHEGSYDSVGDSIRRYWNFVAACLENSLTNNMTRGGEISTNMLKTAATSGPANDSDRELLQFYFQFTRNAVSTSLTNFAVICDRLAPLASKTRTGTFPTSEEAAWIIDYGEKLAHFHEYSGNSYLEPRDDFSMVSRIFGIPVAESVLYAGVARPQALYVVLRYKNRDQLYRGAVLSYREFQRNETENFDDKAWQEVVASGETPAAPPFTRSFLDATAPGAAETNRIKELSFAHADLAKPPRSIPIEFRINQNVLSSAPKQMLNSNEEGWMMSTDDERHVIFIEQLPGKRRLMRDGVPGTEYDSVKFPFPSNDSKHVAYIAKTRGAEFIVLDQQEGKHYMRVIALSQNELPFEFSPNGARLAYAASPDGRKEFVVIDGTEGPEFDSIVPESFSFSSNSLHFAYAARRNGKVSFLKDHKVIAEGDASWSNGGPIGLYLSPDGERVACMVRRGTNWFTIVDGKEVGPFTAISNLGKHAFSSDGKHFAFHAQREGQFVTVLDGQPMEDYSIEGVIFSPAGGHWAIHRSDYEKGLHTVLVDGKPGKMYRGSILGLTFSPDGNRLGYFTHGRADEMISVLHGEEDFEGVEPALFTGIRFSPDSKHFSISGKRGQKAVVIVDGKQYPSADSSQLSGSEVTFSPDSRRWAYEAFHGGRCYWVVSGVEYGPYGRAPDHDSDEPQLSFEETEICFGPDGEHFAFRANRDGRRLLVVDGVEQEIRDEWFPHSVIVFDSANEFHFLTLTSQKIFLNKVTVNRL